MISNNHNHIKRATAVGMCWEAMEGETMNLFFWLVLGHLVGDWMLQSDWMALGKRQHFFSPAGLVHYLTYTATISAILAIDASSGVTFQAWLGFTVSVFLSHWLIDGTQVVQGWMHYLGQRDQTLVRLMVDQTLHLLTLALLCELWLVR
jgi:hypothetical protein